MQSVPNMQLYVNKVTVVDYLSPLFLKIDFSCNIVSEYWVFWNKLLFLVETISWIDKNVWDHIHKLVLFFALFIFLVFLQYENHQLFNDVWDETI